MKTESTASAVRPPKPAPKAAPVSRMYPVGAEVQPQGGVHFRVWAPASKTVSVELFSATDQPEKTIPLTAEPGGYFSVFVGEAAPGTRYRFRLDHGSFPDPVSRFQPEGPHGSSLVIDPQAFPWTDQKWRGRPAREAVIYELHLGTFTPEGTWQAAIEQLAELQRLGITMLEVMPIAEFAGQFGWGYDGVDLFAPYRCYGGPDDARAFINRAHELGMMVILDVVYNHLGPDGNYLPQFSPDYLTKNYRNEWGDSINFDGPHCGPVRELFLTNARYWIEEFHFDGLRIDATQHIFDRTTPHMLSEIVRVAREAGGERLIYIVGENEPQDARLLRPPKDGGHGFDALWSEDFNRSALVAATGRSEGYCLDHRGRAQELVSAVKYGFLYQGQLYSWIKARRGRPAFDIAPEKFVFFLQNHDQVANSSRGNRLHHTAHIGQVRALTALTLLAPATPMLFQGQEFAASCEFLYFADHQPDLRKLVDEGRRRFLSEFRTVAAADCREVLASSGDADTFRRCKLDFSEREKNAKVYRLHADLLRLRREDRTITDPIRIDGAVLGEQAFVIRYFSRSGTDDRLLIVNLSTDLYFTPSPEPLLAPVADRGWEVAWSTEAPEYGSCGTPPYETKAGWIILGHAAVLLKPAEDTELPGARLTFQT